MSRRRLGLGWEGLSRWFEADEEQLVARVRPGLVRRRGLLVARLGVSLRVGSEGPVAEVRAWCGLVSHSGMGGLGVGGFVAKERGGRAKLGSS